MTSDGAQTYEWDAENRLLAVKQGANTIAAYDGNGRRFSKTAGGVTRTYLNDGAQIVEERLSTGGAIKYFDGPGIDQHLGTQDSSGTVSYFASDHLGSVTDVTTSAGNSLTRQYDPWGNLLSGASTSGYAFTGREWDAEVGLYYYRARYYDPKIGRFISEDPLPVVERSVAELNAYAYVANNPVNLVDPEGLSVCIIMGRTPFVFRPPVRFPNQTFNPTTRPPRVTPPRPWFPPVRTPPPPPPPPWWWQVIDILLGGPFGRGWQAPPVVPPTPSPDDIA